MDAADYYKAISRFILPHLRNRPISFKRFVGTDFFWEKDAPGFTPDWVKRVPVPRRGEGEDDIEYIVVHDARTLMWLAGIGGIEIHPFLHRFPRIDLATEVVFDLDPGEGADILDCARVALLLRGALHAVGLESFAKVSGSKGIQVYVPIKPAPHELTEAAAKLIADELALRHPKRITSKMSKVLRRGKVFIDWSQNADYKTTIGVYSLRATTYVSMPVRWSELEKPKRDALYFDAEQAVKRVKRAGDLFEPVLKLKQKLPGAPKNVEAGFSRPQDRRLRGLKPAPHKLPKRDSQSGRRLFVVVKTDTGNELWTDFDGMFKRWILRPDREGTETLIAMPAGKFAIDPAYYRGEVPKAWQRRVTLEDSGAFEIIARGEDWLRLWFSGRVMRGEWMLAKIEKGETHRSWRLAPEKM